MDYIERDEDNPAGRAKYELHSARQFIEHGARMAAMRRYGQKSTGLVEDALTLGAAQLVLKRAATATPPSTKPAKRPRASR